jgi:hypothetical protein
VSIEFLTPALICRYMHTFQNLPGLWLASSTSPPIATTTTFQAGKHHLSGPRHNHTHDSAACNSGGKPLPGKLRRSQ